MALGLEAHHWIRKASDAGSIQAKHSIAYIQAETIWVEPWKKTDIKQFRQDKILK